MRENFIKNEDMKIIESVADKYNLSLSDLGKMLSRKKITYPRFQFSCTEDEYNIVKEKADKLNLSLSGYCVYCFERAIKTKEIDNLNYLQIFSNMRKNRGNKKEENESGRLRISVCLRSNEDYLKAKEISKKLNVPLGVLARYLALNTSL